MAVSDEFVQYVVEQLSSWGEVSVRRMFGGAGLYRGGTMITAEHKSQPQPQTRALFPEDRVGPAVDEAAIVRLRRSELSVPRPRQWGACRLALPLWKQLPLDQFWAKRLPPGRPRGLPSDRPEGGGLCREDSRPRRPFLSPSRRFQSAKSG